MQYELQRVAVRVFLPSSRFQIIVKALTEIMASKGTSLWRTAGVSYLQYVNQSANVVRAALKEPVKSTVQARSNVEFASFKWANGERGERGMSINCGFMSRGFAVMSID